MFLVLKLSEMFQTKPNQTKPNQNFSCTLTYQKITSQDQLVLSASIPFNY